MRGRSAGLVSPQPRMSHDGSAGSIVQPSRQISSTSHHCTPAIIGKAADPK